MLAALEYALLSKFCVREKILPGQDIQVTTYSKLDRHFGADWRESVRDRVVLDFGCGVGRQVIEIARAGARRVYGLEVSKTQLRLAREQLAASGVTERCRISPEPPAEPVDCIFSIDGFEHYDDPAGALRQMHSYLKPGGAVYISFGPMWYHPLGGHAFSPFPWAHVLLAEQALVRWRNDHFPGTSVSIDGSGLNRMTVRRFLALCAGSNFQIRHAEAVPIHRLAWLHNRFTREFTSSVVHAVLLRPHTQPLGGPAAEATGSSPGYAPAQTSV